MQELLIVNPARRPSKRRKTRKAASPAQKRARAAFAAAARARSSNPKRRTAKRKARRSPSVTVMANPRRRSHRRTHARRRSNPISISGFAKKPMAMLTPALVGALGATAVNAILGKLPIPASMMTGRMRYVTQAGAAIALSMIASRVGLKGATAAQMAEGSLTVTLHQAIVDIVGGMVPSLGLSGMGYYLPGVGVHNAIPSRAANSAPMAMNGMGKYISGPGARSNVMSMNGLARQARKTSGFNF